MLQRLLGDDVEIEVVSVVWHLMIVAGGGVHGITQTAVVTKSCSSFWGSGSKVHAIALRQWGYHSASPLFTSRCCPERHKSYCTCMYVHQDRFYYGYIEHTRGKWLRIKLENLWRGELAAATALWRPLRM